MRKKVIMKKKNYTLASATIVGLAIATSGGAALANSDDTTPSTSATAQTPLTAPAPATATTSTSAVSVDKTEPSSAVAPKTTEKDIVLVHTNDVQGRIVEESRFKNI